MYTVGRAEVISKRAHVRTLRSPTLRPPSTSQPSADASTMAALTDIKKLDAHMADNSYVEGYSATQKDVSVFQAISKPADSFPNALR